MQMQPFGSFNQPSWKSNLSSPKNFIRRHPRYTILIVLVVFFLLALRYQYVQRWWPLLVIRWSIPVLDISTIDSQLSPSTPQFPSEYTAALIYLISVGRSRELILSLSYVYRNLPGPPWPIVLFHAGDYASYDAQIEFRSRLFGYINDGGGEGKAGRDAWKFVERIEFVELHWVLPEGIETDKDVLKPVFDYAWPGYHHMCAFFSSQIFAHPRLLNTTYYLRLDTDSYITQPLCYDPILRFHSRNLSYAYRSTKYDQPRVTHGLWKFVESYASSHPEVDERLKGSNKWIWGAGPDGSGGEIGREKVRKGVEVDFPIYYNNFEVVKLEAFRRGEVKMWLDELMSEPGRIYKWRWGDAPIRYATVNMFFDLQTEVEQFCGMRYFHQGPQVPDCECAP